MKTSAVLPVVTLTMALCGCSTTPQSASSVTAPTAASTTAAAPQSGGTGSDQSNALSPTPENTPAPVATTTTETPAEVATAPVKLSPEAEALIDRLTNPSSDAMQHDISASSGFPEAKNTLQPGASAPKFETKRDPNLPPSKGLTADGSSTTLVERDWTGIVLVPVNTALSKAYTSSVRLLRVEAHPLNDGRLRIWARIQNIGAQTLSAEIACAFRTTDAALEPSTYFYELKVPGNTVRDVFFISPDAELLSYTTLVRDTEALQRR